MQNLHARSAALVVELLQYMAQPPPGSQSEGATVLISIKVFASFPHSSRSRMARATLNRTSTGVCDNSHCKTMAGLDNAQN